MAGRIKELISKYGRVALVVHVSISSLSYGACYVAIKNNVDVNEILQSVGLITDSKESFPAVSLSDGTVVEKMEKVKGIVTEKVDASTVKVLNEGGAFAMAFLCNKALLPVRIPLTVVVTPPIARLWAQRSFFR